VFVFIHLFIFAGEEAKSEITSQVGASAEGNIHVHHLDISKPKDVDQFVASFAASGQPLHCLINNAGCMVNERQLTQVGPHFKGNTHHFTPCGLLTPSRPNGRDGVGHPQDESSV
jgi:NAD(P)-dependent dehydrogenase (short-subunit alcohol dehydrogenase family)